MARAVDSSQPLAALGHANKIRSARAELKHQLKTGQRTAADVLIDPPWFAQRMRLEELLLAVPNSGRVRTDRVLRSSRVSPRKMLGGLTDRQVAELIGRLYPADRRRPNG